MRQKCIKNTLEQIINMYREGDAMMDMNAKFDELVEKLNSMNSTEFDEMLIRCGIERIKPSIESSYVSCLRKTFSQKDKEYIVNAVFKMDAHDFYNGFDLDNIGQGAA